jgi:hypothetical protein
MVRYPDSTPFVALTDRHWFDFLRTEAAKTRGALDEVNFWSPSATRPMKNFAVGAPIFFRLKHPFNVVAGYSLTKEFHALFDRGYVTVTPEHEVRVSPRLRKDWHNGHRYYPYDGQRLLVVPERSNLQPSSEALEWHNQRVFLKSA